MKTVQQLRKQQKGATVIEYALIAALIAVVAIVGFRTLGERVDTTLKGVSEALPTPAPAGPSGP